MIVGSGKSETYRAGWRLGSVEDEVSSANPSMQQAKNSSMASNVAVSGISSSFRNLCLCSQDLELIGGGSALPKAY